MSLGGNECFGEVVLVRLDEGRGHQETSPAFLDVLENPQVVAGGKVQHQVPAAWGGHGWFAPVGWAGGWEGSMLRDKIEAVDGLSNLLLRAPKFVCDKSGGGYAERKKLSGRWSFASTSQGQKLLLATKKNNNCRTARHVRAMPR